MAWLPDLIQLFEVMKIFITSSPILIRFDPMKPVFIKIEWSAEDMAWILMQSDDGE